MTKLFFKEVIFVFSFPLNEWDLTSSFIFSFSNLAIFLTFIKSINYPKLNFPLPREG